MNATAGACWHCGEPLPAEPLMAEVGGVPRPVCCHGCRAAAEWIEGLGLGDYYRLRSAPATRPAEDSKAGTWARSELARHAVRRLPDGRSEVGLLVEGMRCSACVWLIERSLDQLPGVDKVQVNATAQRARVVFDAERTTLPEVLVALERVGYRPQPLDATALDDARRRESRAALKGLLVAGFGAMQAMMYATALYLGAFEEAGPATRDLFRWLGLLVATPVVFYAARPFFAGARRTLAARRLGMDVPVALAIALIYAASMIETLRGGSEVYFDSVSMFVFLLLLGRYLEMRARHHAANLSDALARLTPAFADRIRADGSLERIAAAELQAGDRVHVTEGGIVPADGRLEGAHCSVDESLLTGESLAVRRQRGELLVAGSLLVQGPAELRVERVGADTALAGIVALVTRAQTERPRLAQAGERAAARFVARVLALAALTAIAWSFIDPARAFAAMLAVLVVSCPCAFALAVPAALTRALGILAQRGVLVAHADAIEQLAEATHVVFDKTGTLTQPEPGLEQVEVADGLERLQGLELAVSLARGSSHPVARAIAAALPDAVLPAASALQVTAGEGVAGIVDGRRLRLGRASFALAGRPIPPGLESATVLADEARPLAAFRLAERLRPGARELLAELADEGLGIEILSGDAPARVAAVAARLGIGHWHAGQRPADKLARLQALRAQGARVMAVGDGINDAPVLAGADVAVALASGTELAQASSDIVLVGNHLDALGAARRLALQAMAVLRQNQRWSLAYNLTAMPFAALGFVPPWLAALGMSLSSLVVILNALRIGRTPDHAAGLPMATAAGARA
ncbi:MAG: cadmium-translocating P-type ATPase [Gammaproteobacteria bacterium]|nr:cadmium-translocating P-type ATPase [Gammaproteobacteria bacterium]